MSSGADFFLKKTLGEDFLQSLEKFELWKPGTRTTLDHEEIRTALMIVPRTMMSFIIHHLSSMEIGDTKETQLPVQEGGAILRVSKHERDVYSGEIEQNNKKIVDFKYRSIPGVALVIMSAFELYDTNKLLDPPPNEKAPEELSKPGHADIQRMIDERLAMHDMITRVVEKKLSEREAVHQMMMLKLTDELRAEKVKHEKIAEVRKISESSAPQSDPYFRGMTNGIEVANAIVHDAEPKFIDPPKKPGDDGYSDDFSNRVNGRLKKGSPLGDFLQKREEKLKKNEFSVKMIKGETVRCPDCGNALISGEAFTGCICLGDDMDKKIYIKKSEEGVKVRFGRGWDPENIEMLLEVLRSKRG